MVLALAGDSTMTSEVDPAGGGGPRSSSLTLAVFLRLRVFAADFFFAAGRRLVVAAGRAALPRPAIRRVTPASSCSDSVSFFLAMLSVNRSVIGRGAGGIVPRPFHQRTQIVERYSPIDL